MKKKEAWYAVIGGIVGAVLTMAVCSFSPLGAQNDVFEELMCTGLRIVDSHGNTQISLTVDLVDGNQIKVYNLEKPGIVLSTGGGYVGSEIEMYDASDAEDGLGILLSAGYTAHNPGGSKIAMYDFTLGDTSAAAVERRHNILLRTELGSSKFKMYGNDYESAVDLSVESLGSKLSFQEKGQSLVRLSNARGVSSGLSLTAGESKVDVDVRRGEGGMIEVTGKNEKSAQITLDEHGGQVSVLGKGESQAAMGINEYGNGVVNTWDKNGYRLATLK